MKLQKHVKIGGVLGAAVSIGFVLVFLVSEVYPGRGNILYWYFSEWAHPAGTAVYSLIGAAIGAFIFWLLGHLFRFIRHQWNLAAERQAHKRLLKAKQLFDAGIYTELEYQAKLQEIKAG